MKTSEFRSFWACSPCIYFGHFYLFRCVEEQGAWPTFSIGDRLTEWLIPDRGRMNIPCFSPMTNKSLGIFTSLCAPTLFPLYIHQIFPPVNFKSLARVKTERPSQFPTKFSVLLDCGAARWLQVLLVLGVRCLHFFGRWLSMAWSFLPSLLGFSWYARPAFFTWKSTDLAIF